jgi:hypothetical protein
MEVAHPGYKDHCYDPKNRWTRRLFNIVGFRFRLQKYLVRFEKFESDWNRYKEENFPELVLRELLIPEPKDSVAEGSIK